MITRNRSRVADREALEAIEATPRAALIDLRPLITTVDRVSAKALARAILALQVAASVKQRLDPGAPAARRADRQPVTLDHSSAS